MEVTYAEFQLLKDKLETLEEKNELLEKTIEVFKKNIPYIYRQLTNNNTHNDGIFEIGMPIDHVLSESLIYFLPYEAGMPITEENPKNILRIKQGNKTIGDYTFVKESITGVMSNVGLGVIAPNRTLILRLIHSNVSEKRAVVINANLENEVSVGMLSVLGSSIFKEVPSLEIEGQDPDSLAKTSDLNQLRSEFDELRGSEITKFKVGTEEASVALADEPVGTLYVLMGDDYVES